MSLRWASDEVPHNEVWVIEPSGDPQTPFFLAQRLRFKV